MSDDLLAKLGWNSFFEKQISAEERREFMPARVAAVHKFAFMLTCGEDPFPAVVAGKLLQEHEEHPDLPVVGDWVLAKPPEGGTTVIVRRLDRRSELARRRPTDRNADRNSSARQALVANVDYVFIVSSLNLDLNPARLERALVLVWNSGATPVVLLSKADLCPEAKSKVLEIQTVCAGADVHEFSSVSRDGLREIEAYFKPGITGCLIGSSGVGKTTLINALLGSQFKTLAIREEDDKGRHATTARSLFLLPGGGMIMDTPGLREIGLLDDEGLNTAFADIADLARACKFKDCTHQVEPGCAVLGALAAGELAQERYTHYLKLRREAEYHADRLTTSGQLEIKKKQKQLGKLIKSYHQNHG